ncbi:MAG: MFS transporter [bacterium]|nr:MFS transporter [bacterium]
MSRQANTWAPLRDAWPLLLGCFAIEFIVIGGGIDTVSVFLNELSSSEGWSRQGLSTGIAVGAVTAGLVTPGVGWMVDRYGVRVPILVGTLFLAAGFGVLLSMSDPWHFVVANLLLGPGFAFSAMLPITVAVTVLMPSRTALALGIVTMGSSLGALILAPVTQGMIDSLGWRHTYLALGGAALVTPIVCVLFALPRGQLRKPTTSDATDEATPRQPLQLGRVLRRPGLLPMVGVLMIPGLGSFGIQVHLVPYLSDQGHGVTFAAGALGAVIGISAIGKLGGGLLADRLGVVVTMRLALLLAVMGSALLLIGSSSTAVWLFVALHGLSFGTQVAVMPVVAMAILGRENFGTLYGLLQLATIATIGAAPIIPGVIYEATGSYRYAVFFWIAVMVSSFLIAFFLHLPTSGSGSEPRPRPESESE